MIEVRAIGRIRTPFVSPAGTPIQTVYADGAQGTVEVSEAFADGLADIEGFERIWLLYWCDQISKSSLRVVPYRDTQEHGIFATRAPARPNPIGLSCVRLTRVDGRVLHVADVDMLDNSPLLDIKPYIPAVDSFVVTRSGWFDLNRADRTVADQRFHNNDDSGAQARCL